MSESDAAKLAAVAWIREQMDRHGLTFDDLVEAGCFADSEDGDAVTVETDVPPTIALR